MGEPRWLTADEARAWRAYRRMQMQLAARLARDLAHDSGLSEPDYEVLSTLSEKPGHRWPLRDLATKMLWSRSRLSHHLARMEGRGLVVREDDPNDRRGCMVALTEAGRKTLVQAAPGHVASVREHLIDLLSEGELATLADISVRVGDRLVGTTLPRHTGPSAGSSDPGGSHEDEDRDGRGTLPATS